MDAVTQQLMQQLAGTGLSMLSQKIGADEKTTASALSAAMPLLVTALANNAAQPDGARALHKALSKDHDGSVLNDVSGYLNNPSTDDGAAILGHILGNRQPVVTRGLTQGTGLNGDQVAQLLQIAAPLIMGVLGQQQRQGGLDTNALSSYLGGQQQAVQQSNPDMMTVLNTLLDADKDGSAVDEVVGLMGKLFGGK